MDHLLGRILMAFQAGPGDLLAGFERAFHKGRMVDRRGAARNAVPGGVGNLPGDGVVGLGEIPDRDRDQGQDENETCDPAGLPLFHGALIKPSLGWA